MAWSGNFDDFADGYESNMSRRWTTTNTYPSNSDPVHTGTTAIRNLVVGVNNITIVGVVIAKESSKAILSKKNPGSERHLLSFTVRDSSVDFINATCWGSKDHIQMLASMFHIGDVIEINNPQIQSKPQDGTDERFRPYTSSPFQMNISENYSILKLYGGWNMDKYDKLKHLPIKDNSDYYTLEDVISNGQNLDKEHISLLASVKHIGPTKDIVTKTGRHTQRCELKLFDDTCSSFPLILWDREQIDQIQTLTPRDCVLFAVDVRVSYDDFRKSMIATADCKTVFILNPDTREAHSLYRYAQTVDFDEFASEDNGREPVNLDDIQEVLTVEMVKQECQNRKDLDCYYAIVFAYLTMLNLDGDEAALHSVKCAKCRRCVDKVTHVCVNASCPASVSDLDVNEADVIEQWNLSVTLSDYTGSIDRCLLCGDVATTMLGCDINDFLAFPEHQRTELKWKFLLEKCKVYLKVSLPISDSSKPVIRILSCALADPVEAMKHLR